MEKSIFTDKYKKFVVKLKLARIEASLKQSDVAHELGRPQSFVSRIESGQRRVDVVEITELAKIYKKPVSFFVDWE